jgi:hypothetical protein
MSEMQWIDVDGQRRPLGLLMPESKPRSFPLFSSAQKVMSRDEIQEILADKNYRTARQQFPNNIWIKSQGGRGSCNGYAGAKALERLRVKEGRKHIPLSGEGLYAQINKGRDQGSMLDDGMKALMENGVPPEYLVKHEEFLWKNISAEAKGIMKFYKALECYTVDTNEELASGLAQGFVGVVAVHVGRAFNTIDSDGRVGAGMGPGNHAVLVDDVRIFSNQFEFDMANSWGLRWGDNGRGWLAWNRHLSEPNKHHAFYLIRSATDDNNSNPPQVIA